MSAGAVDALVPQCGYQGYEFGGGYLDSICIDGRLHDADDCDNDGNVYLKDEDIPCPMCRPLDAIAWWTDRNSMFWEEDEDMDDEPAHEARAREAAVSLVTDIRRNRGVATDLDALATQEARRHG